MSSIDTHRLRLSRTFGVSLWRAPAYSSVRLILRSLGAEALERVFRRLAESLAPATGPDEAAPSLPAIAIDGKTLRGSFAAFHDRKAAHLLSAFASDGQIILGHLTVAEKITEIPAAQELIAALGLTGRLFTLASLHCRKSS